MKIYIGSKNPAKVKAVSTVFPSVEVRAVEVSSNVSPQPFSDKETMDGAINRAKASASISENVIGIGLEGGVMEISGTKYLCNWGALVSENGEVFVAAGARIPLPEEISTELEKGIELGEIMDAYTKKKEVRKHEGAIGIFTADLVKRDEMFTHTLKLLKGQYQYSKHTNIE